MSVHLYSIAWNEARVLEFFLRHYESVVDRFIIYDDGSTDGTQEMLRNHAKVELRPFVRRFPGSLILSIQEIWNEYWKESRGKADWVITANIDEHLYHPNLSEYLLECRRKSVTAIPALGYEMLSETFPSPGALLCETITRGAPRRSLSKLAIFDPNAVHETNCGVGRHSAYPTGRIVWPERDELLLLHYKYLGGAYFQQRHGQLAAGLGRTDVRWGWATHWKEFSKSNTGAVLEDFLASAVDVRDPALEPWNSHGEPRWWHGQSRGRWRNLKPMLIKSWIRLMAWKKAHAAG